MILILVLYINLFQIQLQNVIQTWLKYTSSVDQWHCIPCKIAVDVSKDFHEVRMDRGEGHAGRLAHVDGAFLSQVHVVEIYKLKLRLLLWPTTED